MADEPKPTPPKKRKPLGPPLVHTDEELDALAAVTDADIEAAGALWRANAGRLSLLLEAKQQEGTNGAI